MKLFCLVNLENFLKSLERCLKKKIYLSGSKTKFYFSELFFGSIRYKIKNCGHFSFFENSYEFSKNFSKLINGRTLDLR